MDHRTGLRGTETGTRVGTLRRKGLARISPSRDPLHRSVRLPGSREEPFFPLTPRRPCWITSPEAPAGLRAARRRDAFAPNGIILNPSQVYGLRLRGTYQVSFPIVRSVARFVCNTVVLARVFRGLHTVMGITAPSPDHNERSFVFMWLGVIAFCTAFCAFLFYLMIYVF